MLIGIAAFEWRYATRRLTFAAAAVLFALMGYALAATSFGADDIPVNAPYAIAYSTGFLSLLSVFALTVLVAPSLLRDAEHRMAEIVYATSVTKADYLLGRFAGSLLAACGAFAFGMAGMLAGALRHDPDRVAAVRLLDYAWAFSVMALPSMVLVGALLFTVAAISRRSLATYVAGVCVYVLYLAAAIMTSSPLLASSGPVSPEGLAFAALADPFGLSAFFEQTRYWTTAERGVMGVRLSGRFLQNRILWTAVAALLLLLAHRVFAFRVAAPLRSDDVVTTTTGGVTPYRPVPVSGGGWGPALASTLRLECRTVLRSWPLAALQVLWTATAVIEVKENLRSVEYGTALLPTAGLLVGTFQQPLLMFGLLVIVYYAAEVVWRERTTGIHEIVDATRASSALFVVSKVGALAVLVGALLVVPVVVGLGTQLASGHRPLEVAVHLSQLYSGGLPLLLFAVLAVAIQAVSPNRHAGMLATLLAAVCLPLGGPGSPEHPLLRYAAVGALGWSDMNGRGPMAAVFHAFMGYWSLLAALLALFACGAWRRGTDPGLGRRLRRVPSSLGRPGRLAAAGFGLAFAGVGAVLFHHTNVASAWESSEDRLAWKAEYETTYQHLKPLAQPRITHLDTQVDLFPAQRRLHVRARARLVNETASPITQVWVAARRDLRTVSMTVGGQAAIRQDPRFGMSAFDVALAPGASVELAYELVADRSALTPDVRHDVVDNGSFFFGPLVFPTVGYRSSYEIEDPAERQRRGLTERRHHPAGKPELMTFDLVVGAPADQTVVASGVLKGSWDRDGRRYSRFGVDRPVPPVIAVAAARYVSARARAGEIDVEVLHHPGHEANVPRVLEAAVRSLDEFSRSYGPYPYPQLRIAELPAHHTRFAGFAVPGAVYFTEDRGFLTDLGAPGRLDIVTKRTAHEIAHQWWGHQVTPADGPGASAVVETLARYSELVILRQQQGPGAVTAALRVELDRYLGGRAREREVPLDRVEDQAWLYYAKGALVMTALHELIGEDAMNRALRALVAQSPGDGPAPTVQDLVGHLRRETPAKHRWLLDEMWSSTVLYDLRVVSAEAQSLPDGRTRVTARIEGRKARLHEGRETSLPMDERLEVAVYGAYPGDGTTPLHTEHHEIRGDTVVSFVVQGEPAWVAVDPRLTRIDRNVEDNVRALRR